MRRIQHDQALNAIGMRHRPLPRGGASPVVSDDDRALITEVLHESLEIVDDLAHPVGRDIARLAGKVEPAQIGCNGVMARAEVRYDVFPRGPVFGKAMQEQHQRSPGLAATRVVQSDSICQIGKLSVSNHRADDPRPSA